jgi:hypothetical protein
LEASSFVRAYKEIIIVSDSNYSLSIVFIITLNSLPRFFLIIDRNEKATFDPIANLIVYAES